MHDPEDDPAGVEVAQERVRRVCAYYSSLIMEVRRNEDTDPYLLGLLRSARQRCIEDLVGLDRASPAEIEATSVLYESLYRELTRT